MRSWPGRSHSRGDTQTVLQPQAYYGLRSERKHMKRKRSIQTWHFHGWFALLISFSMSCHGVGTAVDGDVILTLGPYGCRAGHKSHAMVSQTRLKFEKDADDQHELHGKKLCLFSSALPDASTFATEAQTSLHELRRLSRPTANHSATCCSAPDSSLPKLSEHNMTSLLRSHLSDLIKEGWWQDCLNQKHCHSCMSVNREQTPASFGVACPVSLKWTFFFCKKCLVGCRPLPPHFISLYRRCRLCRRFATFGPINGHRMSAAHCKEHKHADEVDVVCRKCSSPGCARRALFGQPKYMDDFKTMSSGNRNVNSKFIVIPERCGFHRKKGDMGSPKKFCQVPGCYQYATQGSRSWNNGARVFCAKHKPIDFHDLNSKRCKFPLGCDRLANYGNPAEGLARFCASHRSWGDVHLKRRICNHYKCWSTAAFSTRSIPVKHFCKKHWRPKGHFVRQLDGNPVVLQGAPVLPRPNTPEPRPSTHPLSESHLLCLSPVTPCESGLTP